MAKRWSVGVRRDRPESADRPQRGAVEREEVAGSTGLEPAASGVTGRRSNQLNYDPAKPVECNRKDAAGSSAVRPRDAPNERPKGAMFGQAERFPDERPKRATFGP